MSFDSRVAYTRETRPNTRAPKMTRTQLLTKVLQAVTAADGISHDSFNADGEGPACSLGSAVRMFGNLKNIAAKDAMEIAEANDMYPDITPKMRRRVMIEWLHEQLAKEGV